MYREYDQQDIIYDRKAFLHILESLQFHDYVLIKKLLSLSKSIAF